MSVYTPISDDEFSEILKSYGLGKFISSRGIEAGIENTNYFITTSKDEYVFTLFEKLSKDEVYFYISLLQELSAAGIACPQPQINLQQHAVSEIKSKPFTLVSRLAGKNVSVVNTEQCKAIATELAKFHSTIFSNSNPANPLLQNRRGKAWREKTANELLTKLSAEDVTLITSELTLYESFDDSKLPKGIIHADLFPDNALFVGNQLSGIIDFYDACYDNYLYDVAITFNAWCSNDAGELNQALATAFLESYQRIRPFSHDEDQAWPIMLRMAAMRFWLSRLEADLVKNSALNGEGILTQAKNPAQYRKILENYTQSAVN